MTLQFLADGVVAGSMIGLGAVGVTLTYSILRFANFAQGEFISWGCYLTWVLAGAIAAWLPGWAEAGTLSVGWNVGLAAVLAMALTGLLAIAFDVVLFRTLRRRGLPIAAVIASFGVSMAFRALIEAVFSSKQQYFSNELAIGVPIGGGMRVTPDQMALVAVTVLVAGALHGLLRWTHMGRSMRAVSEDPTLARVVGIDVERVIRKTWFIGGALACASGVMLGLVVQIRPTMGAELLLPLFAAAVFGGIGSVPGAMQGGLVVGIAEAAAVQFVGAEWRAAVAFLVVIAVLLARPNGLYGRAA